MKRGLFVIWAMMFAGEFLGQVYKTWLRVGFRWELIPLELAIALALSITQLACFVGGLFILAWFVGKSTT